MRLLDAYAEMRDLTQDLLRPGTTVASLETPASTILKQHRKIALKEGMTVTVGHMILAEPGSRRRRHEDVYLVTPDGGRALVPYPVAPEVSV